MLRRWLENETKVTLFCVILGAVSLALSLSGALGEPLPFDIAWTAIILCGTPIVTGACRALVMERNVKADMLVSIALVASAATREWFAAGEVAIIMQIGSLLEDCTSARARKGIEGLVKLTPRTARVRRGREDVIVPAEEVRVGDTLTVLAGETIPVDGILTKGGTSVNQSVMTGESIPVDIKEGDELISGTLNQYGTFEMRAEKASGDSSLQRMIALAETADAEKAPVVRLADRWATWLVFAALGCAAAAWLLSGDFERAVTVLVVFCPCAFILATPAAVAAAIGNLTRYGILIRTGDALQRLAEVECIAFDKTGTLTYGKPAVTEIAAVSPGSTSDGILMLAAAAEQNSEHPLGKAVLAACMKGGSQLLEAVNTTVLAGQGISAEIASRRVIVGKPGLMEQEGIDMTGAAWKLRELYGRGATVIAVAADGTLMGLIALSDTVREDTPDTVAALKEQGITPVLLTGDNEAAAGSIARIAGISEVRSSMMQEDKMSFIKESGRKTAMIGDGVNDALALSGAYAGIAMGGIGSDIAVESADAVLVSDDIKRIPYLMRMTRKCMARIRQNIVFSLVINFIAIILSASGVLVPVTAALWHNFGSVFVMVNAVLLLRERDR